MKREFTGEMIDVLLVEDNEGDARLVREMVRYIPSLNIVRVDCLAAGIDHLATKKADVVLLDLGLPDSRGADTLKRVLETDFSVPVVVFTGNDDDAAGQAAVRQGAQDYLIKGSVDERTLARSIHYALERKRSEMALARERQRFKQILDSFPYGIFIVARDYGLEYVNPFLLKGLGDPSARKCYEYFHNLSEPCSWCPNDRVFQGETVQWELHYERNDRKYELVAIPLSNDDGTVSMLAVFRDITESKQAQERIQLQLDELQRWQAVMLNREDRIRELKQQVNALHRRLGEPARYPSQEKI